MWCVHSKHNTYRSVEVVCVVAARLEKANTIGNHYSDYEQNFMKELSYGSK